MRVTRERVQEILDIEDPPKVPPEDWPFTAREWWLHTVAECDYLEKLRGTKTRQVMKDMVLDLRDLTLPVLSKKELDDFAKAEEELEDWQLVEMYIKAARRHRIPIPDHLPGFMEMGNEDIETNALVEEYRDFLLPRMHDDYYDYIEDFADSCDISMLRVWALAYEKESGLPLPEHLAVVEQ